MLVPVVTTAPRQREEQDWEGRPVVRALRASHHAQTEGTMPVSPSQRTKAQVDGLCLHLGCSWAPHQSPWRISKNGAGIQLWLFSGPRGVCLQEPANDLHFGSPPTHTHKSDFFSSPNVSLLKHPSWPWVTDGHFSSESGSGGVSHPEEMAPPHQKCLVAHPLPQSC